MNSNVIGGSSMGLIIINIALRTHSPYKRKNGNGAPRFVCGGGVDVEVCMRLRIVKSPSPRSSFSLPMFCVCALRMWSRTESPAIALQPLLHDLFCAIIRHFVVYHTLPVILLFFILFLLLFTHCYP